MALIGLAGGGCVTTMALGMADEKAPVVRTVAIAGNEDLDDDDIIDGLATHPPEGFFLITRYRYDPMAAEIDRRRIETFYKMRGYFSAAVTDIEVERAGENEVDVTFVVAEGEPTRIAELELENVPPDVRASEYLQSHLDKLAAGTIYDHEAYEEAKTRLLRALQAAGFAHASVSGHVDVNRELREAYVTLAAEPGARAYFGETTIRTAGAIPESAVRARILWEPAELFDPEKLEATRGRLYKLGVFGSVQIDYPADPEAEILDITITTTEGHTREVLLGGGFAFDDVHYELRGRAGYLIRGLFDPLLTLRMEARPAYRILRNNIGGGNDGFGGEASVALERDDLFVPLLRGSAELAYEVIELEAYGTQGPRARLFVTRPFWDEQLVAGAGWTFRYLDLFNVHPAIAGDAALDIGAVEPYRLGFFFQDIVFDRRDDLLDPHRGVFSELHLEEGNELAGGAFDYVKATFEARGYVPLAEHIVFAARGLVGGVPFGDLPLTQRFYSGGASSHRGFGQRRLSPILRDRDLADGDSGIARIGGEALFQSSFEVRVDVLRIREQWAGVTAFLDGADVTNGWGQLDFTNLHWAAGLGLRYNTLIGPIRFDVGYRLNRTGPGEPDAGDRFAFHLSLGEAF